jgi:hypothetical protein
MQNDMFIRIKKNGRLEKYSEIFTEKTSNLKRGYKMIDVQEAKKLVGYCGIYCGSCGMYKGRIYAQLAQELLEILKTAGYPDELTINPKGIQPDFNYHEFLKGMEYFSKEQSGAYCQEACKQGAGVPCKTRPCAQERGLEICYECKDFPCENFSKCLEYCPEKQENYERFKKLGFENWVRFHAKRAGNGYANATQKYYTPTKKNKKF